MYVRAFIAACAGFGWTGGPEFKTRIRELPNGHERRNADWENARHRFTHGYVEAGTVTAVEAPEELEYTWLHDGATAGKVRFVLVQDDAFGNRVELTQTIPGRLADRRAEALAAWHTHLELLFAAVQGQVRCWPEGRTEELTQRYRSRLEAGGPG